jgi:hypothetical protein
LEFAHDTQFKYNKELYEIFVVSLEQIMGVPIGAEDENKAIYVLGDTEKRQLSDLIVAYN